MHPSHLRMDNWSVEQCECGWNNEDINNWSVEQCVCYLYYETVTVC